VEGDAMMKKLNSLLSFLLVLSVSCICFSACNDQVDTAHTGLIAPADYGNEIMEYLVERQSFDEIIHCADLLLVAECTRVEPNTPQQGYTRYSFTIMDDLTGNYKDSEFSFCVPRAKISAGEYVQSLGTDEYQVGETYMLPFIREPYLQDWMYIKPNPGLSINLSKKEYKLFGEDISVPKGTTMEEYALNLYRQVDHPTKTLPVYEYDNEFEEFWTESQFVCRIRAEKYVEKISSNTLTCSVLELFKGDAKELHSLYEEGWITIGTAKGISVEVGTEYIIGFNPVAPGSLAYTMSTNTSLKNVEEDILLEIRTRLYAE
ncbi:MAG: hypothetical protein J5794_00800, partial [Lachnospiraceae bacterium]|nr:hypothetical protein [Lachnospiraceae bacterium]